MISYGIGKVVRYLPRFTRFVFSNFPSAWFAVVVAVTGVLLEYGALSVMIPLSDEGRGDGRSSAIAEVWRDIVSRLGLQDEPRTWLWLFILLLGVRVAVGFCQIGLNTWVSKRILAHLSGGTFSRVIVHEPLKEIYRRTVGYYTALAGDEAVRIGQVFFHLAQMLSAVFASIIGLVVLYLFSPPAFNLTLLFLFLSGLGIGIAAKWLFAWTNESIGLSREANTMFIEAFNGIRSIRSMAGEQFATQRYRDLIDRYSRVLFYLDLFNYGARSVPALILIALGVVVLFPSSGLLGDISVVYFFTVTVMLIRVLSFLGTAVASGGRVAIDLRSAFDIDDIIGRGPSTAPEKSKKPITKVENIAFNGLTCGYLDGQHVLGGATAELRAGRCYALVGKSGSGKSMLSDVLLGLLEPSGGDLWIEAEPYERVDLASLRQKVMVVEQQTRIFSGSVRDNIAFGRPISSAEMDFAVDVAGLREFVNDLPRGLDTKLEYQGANLSGGQRQRIGLARAIARRPDVLILDEATSALDAQTRDAVLQRLRHEFKDAILVFITHDLHVIHSVDEIWRIKNGKLLVETQQRKTAS